MLNPGKKLNLCSVLPQPSTALAGSSHIASPTHRVALPSMLVLSRPTHPHPSSLILRPSLIHSLLQGPPVRFHLLAVRVADRGGPHWLPTHARNLPHRAVARLCAGAREAAGTPLQEAQPGPGALRSSSTELDVPYMRTAANKRCQTPKECSASLSHLPGVTERRDHNSCLKSGPTTHPQ